MDEKKVREAIEALKIINLKRVHPFYDWEEMREVRDIAIEALEKQLPKKVVIWGNRTEHCPVCDKDVTCTGFCVCPECYQLLDWSEAH